MNYWFVVNVIVLIILDRTEAIPEYRHPAPYHESQKIAYVRGSIQPRIVNGQPATSNQFPHQVSYFALSKDGKQQIICGGSLISPDWVLTAAHCAKDRIRFDLRFGSLNLQSGGISMTSFLAIVHENYNPTNANNDIAVIRNPSSVSLSASINVVRLPSKGQKDYTFENVRSTASGFGKYSRPSDFSDILRWVDMKVISNGACARYYGSAVIVKHVLCGVGYVNPNNQGVCSGDSGGPLVIDENGIKTLIGIISFNDQDGCDLGTPSGYMRTSHFLDWITAKTNIVVRP